MSKLLTSLLITAVVLSGCSWLRGNDTAHTSAASAPQARYHNADEPTYQRSTVYESRMRTVFDHGRELSAMETDRAAEVSVRTSPYATSQSSSGVSNYVATPRQLVPADAGQSAAEAATEKEQWVNPDLKSTTKDEKAPVADSATDLTKPPVM